MMRYVCKEVRNCDVKMHAVTKLASNLLRIPLSNTSNQMPKCVVLYGRLFSKHGILTNDYKVTLSCFATSDLDFKYTNLASKRKGRRKELICHFNIRLRIQSLVFDC
ncbi:uncharacterized protein LOC110936386 isoform X2 [Helianthus annuus]|uniref:uncharacterized protein LOC110936386 isoform X2 n=1 Tax=Helianthus annuus TaxID=4232 RepID=UPI000B8F0550|nr:uncharacterized protein LOC110936386 isoform X2 [Helianthus annuus]